MTEPKPGTQYETREILAATWQAEVVRLIERSLPERGPFVVVLRGDGQGRLFVHGDGGAPSVVRIR